MKKNRIPRDSFRKTRILRPGNAWRATLTVVEYNSAPAVLKDFSAANWWFRNTVAGSLARREARAYRRLSGVKGIPRFYGRVGNDGVLIEYVEGENTRSPNVRQVGEDYFYELRTILASIRSAGILHFDLPRNILVARDGSPFVVDFQPTVVTPRWPRSLNARVLELASQHNEHEILRLKELLNPGLLTSEELVRKKKGPPFKGIVDVVGKTLGMSLYVVVLLVTRRRPLRDPSTNHRGAGKGIS